MSFKLLAHCWHTLCFLKPNRERLAPRLQHKIINNGVINKQIPEFRPVFDNFSYKKFPALPISSIFSSSYMWIKSTILVNGWFYWIWEWSRKVANDLWMLITRKNFGWNSGNRLTINKIFNYIVNNFENNFNLLKIY